MRRLSTTTIQALITIGLTVSTASAQKMYWADSSSGKIQRANLDGTNIEDLVSAEEANNPGAIALDLTADGIYWAAFAFFGGRIQRADLDGTNVELILTGEGVSGIAIDRGAGEMYFTIPSDCDPLCGSVRRASLDGTNREYLLAATNPKAIALHLAAGKMCWAAFSDDIFSTEPLIRCGNLDGSGVTTILSNTSASGVAIDPSASKIYWTDPDALAIRRANLNGTNIEDLVTTGLTNPVGIALDLESGRMYWTDPGSGKIKRANLNGSNVEDLVTGLSAPRGIALDLRPTVTPPDPAPAVSEWGMAALVLLLLVALSIVFRRVTTAT